MNISRKNKFTTYLNERFYFLKQYRYIGRENSTISSLFHVFPNEYN